MESHARWITTRIVYRKSCKMDYHTHCCDLSSLTFLELTLSALYR